MIADVRACWSSRGRSKLYVAGVFVDDTYGDDLHLRELATAINDSVECLLVTLLLRISARRR